MWKPTTRDQSISGCGDQAGEELVLAGRGGEDDVGPAGRAPAGSAIARATSRAPRRGPSGRGPRRQDLERIDHEIGDRRRAAGVMPGILARDGHEVAGIGQGAGRSSAIRSPAGPPIPLRVANRHGDPPRPLADRTATSTSRWLRVGPGACPQPELLAERLAFDQVAEQRLSQERLRRARRWPTGAGRGTATCVRSVLHPQRVYADFHRRCSFTRLDRRRRPSRSVPVPSPTAITSLRGPGSVAGDLSQKPMPPSLAGPRTDLEDVE